MAVSESDSNDPNTEKQSSGRRWPDWYPVLATFRKSEARKAAWQLINTFVPYCCLWYLMTRSIQRDYPYAVTMLLAVPAGAFLVRLFILFHDCVHGSFFKQQGANTFFGYFLGVLVFTAFDDWRFAHLRHHVTYANLDTRGFGDIWTMTRAEYERSPQRKRLHYRLYRTPLIMIGLGAVFTFFLRNRLPTRKVKRKERASVLFTNLLIVAVILMANWVIGWRTYLLIQLPVFWFAGAAGVWLFYVQHQFPGGYWARKGAWEPLRAAMEGSSFYKLPAVLRWFSSNIGYHHVHHLSPRIPNYRLKECFDTVPALQAKAPLTIGESLACARLKLWDEKMQKMVDFS
jgi:omega-6 fatty acid desaturase (delta-12 desaturase)